MINAAATADDATHDRPLAQEFRRIDTDMLAMLAAISSAIAGWSHKIQPMPKALKMAISNGPSLLRRLGCVVGAEFVFAAWKVTVWSGASAMIFISHGLRNDG